MRAGRARFLAHRGGRIVLAPDGDADGLAAGVLAARAAERLGARTAFELTRKGETAHDASFARRLAARGADLVVVLDQGSRAQPVAPEGTPVLLVDHHRPEGFPPGATVVSAFGHEPVASASWLAWELFSAVAPLADLGWVAALGAVADLGPDAPLPGLPALVARHGRGVLTRAASLVNAAARAPGHDVAVALAALLDAPSPAELARATSAPARRLQALREEIRAETKRCAAVRPVFAGRFALLAMRSAAKVHPLVARQWATRLARFVVVAANFDYLPGRVNFALRSELPVDLIEVLRALPAPAAGEFAHGHPRATGGSLAHADFFRLLEAMGFSRAAASAASGGHAAPP